MKSVDIIPQRRSRISSVVGCPSFRPPSSFCCWHTVRLSQYRRTTRVICFQWKFASHPSVFTKTKCPDNFPSCASPIISVTAFLGTQTLPLYQSFPYRKSNDDFRISILLLAFGSSGHSASKLFKMTLNAFLALLVASHLLQSRFAPCCFVQPVNFHAESVKGRPLGR